MHEIFQNLSKNSDYVKHSRALERRIEMQKRNNESSLLYQKYSSKLVVPVAVHLLKPSTVVL